MAHQIREVVMFGRPLRQVHRLQREVLVRVHERQEDDVLEEALRLDAVY